MSLPGLNFSTTETNTTESTHTIDLKPETEWRYEVAIGGTLHVTLKSGTAEIFGTELPPNKELSIQGKGSIYTWQGCQFVYTAIAGPKGLMSDYTTEDTPHMTMAINLHFALEKMRNEAEQKPKDVAGPRVLIAGPPNSGKTSLAKILLAYATKCDRKPIYISLDPTSVNLGPPGGVHAVQITDLLDVETYGGFGSSEISGPQKLQPLILLSKYFGLEKTTDNFKLFKRSVAQLAVPVLSKLAHDVEAQKSGLIIDTPRVPGNQNKTIEVNLLTDVVSDFGVNVIVVIGNDRLYADLMKKYPVGASGPTVVKVPAFACMDDDESYNRDAQQQEIQQYFYGDAKDTKLGPRIVTVDFSTLHVYKIKPSTQFDDDKADMLERVAEANILPNTVLTVMHAVPGSSEKEILDSEVQGYLHVTEVDEEKNKVKILTPVPGRLPSQVMLLGDTRYHE